MLSLKKKTYLPLIPLLLGIPLSTAFLGTPSGARTRGVPLNVATGKPSPAPLTVIEAGIEAQWNALKKVNGDNVRPTFSIPRDAVRKGTHSIASIHANARHHPEEDVKAAFDLALYGDEPSKKYDFGRVLGTAVEEATIALKAFAFVVREAVDAIDYPRDRQISGGNERFQVLLESARAFVESCTAFLPQRQAKQLGSRYSVTRPVGAGKGAKHRSTISLSPEKAFEIWGYNANADSKQKKLQSSFGLWKDHVYHSGATAASQALERVQVVSSARMDDLVSVWDGAMTATVEFQKHVTGLYSGLKDRTALPRITAAPQPPELALNIDTEPEDADAIVSNKQSSAFFFARGVAKKLPPAKVPHHATSSAFYFLE